MLIISVLHEVMASLNLEMDTIRPVVFIGHDRGARVAHHLHVSSPHSPIQGFSIRGLALLDIVPTQSQWDIGGSVPAATGFFHWSFLANPQIAIPMIQAYGGDKWARDMIERWEGNNTEGQENIKRGRALEVYGSFFERAEVVTSTTMDYKAGATTDLLFEKQAVDEGKRISVPLMLVYSAEFLPKRVTKPILEVWSQPWSEEAHLINECPIGDDIGHFVPEEALEATADEIQGWLKTLTS